MDAHKTILLGAGIFTLFIYLTGFWVRSDGKPYSWIILTIHKLFSLAVVVLLGVTIYRINQVDILRANALTAVIVTGLLVIITILSGGIWSIEKTIPAAVLRVHQVTPYLTLLSTAATLYLLVS